MVITSDVWTDINMTAYLGFTIHYILDEEEIKSLTLGLVSLNEPHISAYLCQKMDEMLLFFGIDKKQIFKVITDRANNIDLAVEMCFGNGKQIPCFAHKLQSVVNDVINEDAMEDNSSVAAAKQIVSFVTRKVNAVDDLEKLQAEISKALAIRFNVIIEIQS